MSEHLRHLVPARPHRRCPACPTPGLPMLGKDGASYPLTPEELADAHDHFTRDFGLALVGGCCGTTPEHLRQVVERVRRPRPGHPRARVRSRASPRSTSTCRSARTRRTSRSASAPTPTARRAFREAMLEERWDDCVEIARDQTRDGAHLLDVCIDYVGRDGVADMKRGRRPLRHGVDAAARARLHRAGGDRGRAGAARRAVGHQLGQLRGRRRARRRGSPGSCRSSSEHGAAVVALTHRRGGPGPHRRVEGAGRRPG